MMARRDPRPAGERHAEQRRSAARTCRSSAALDRQRHRREPTRAPSRSTPRRRSAGSGRAGPVDADLHAPLHSDVPTLLLSGEADPVTPPATPSALARGLAHQRHSGAARRGARPARDGLHAAARWPPFSIAPMPQALDAACLGAASSRTLLRRHRPGPRRDRGMLLSASDSARSRRCATCPSRRATARSPGCSGPTAPASRPRLRMLYGVLDARRRQRAHRRHRHPRRDLRSTRARLGVLPHAAGLYSNLTARENIDYFGALHGIAQATPARAHRASLRTALGMEGFIDRRAKGLLARPAHQGGRWRGRWSTTRATSCSMSRPTAST